MMIELGWPVKALSPNHRSRSHWPRTRALKAARLEGFGACHAALNGHGFAAKWCGSKICFLITAYPPDKRARDDDNVKASLKGHRDGIAQALGIDDSRFAERFQWGEPVRNGKVVITLSETV